MDMLGDGGIHQIAEVAEVGAGQEAFGVGAEEHPGEVDHHIHLPQCRCQGQRVCQIRPHHRDAGSCRLNPVAAACDG